MSARFTVLLSTYNGEKYLAEQLESILCQTLAPEHILVRDDGSTDGTPDVLKRYEAEGKVTLLPGGHVGFLESFRLLLAAASDAPFFAFSDQDDVWLPDKLERAAEYLSGGEKNRPRLYHGAYRQTDEALAPIRDFLPKQPPFTFRRALTENVCSGFALAGNAALRNAMLEFDWAALDYHDWLAGAIALSLGEAFFDPKMTALHRRLSTSVTRDTATKGCRWALSAMRRDTNMKKRNVAFYRCYGGRLSGGDAEYAALFSRFDFAARMKKAFFPKRWRYGLADEIAVRLAMLFGTL